jgi:hypothetical protein
MTRSNDLGVQAAAAIANAHGSTCLNVLASK